MYNPTATTSTAIIAKKRAMDVGRRRTARAASTTRECLASIPKPPHQSWWTIRERARRKANSPNSHVASFLYPAAALAEWRSACAELLGHDLADDDPVFIRPDRQLDEFEPITRDAPRGSSSAPPPRPNASHSPSWVRHGRSRRRRHQRSSQAPRPLSNIRSIDPDYRKTEIWGRNNPSQRLAGCPALIDKR